MDGADQTKGVAQLLLSPLFLIEDILGAFVPGALLLLLLAHKGSPILRHAWLHSPFGYKTNIAIFALLSYVVGKALVLPILFIIASKSLYDRVAAEVRKSQAVVPTPPGGASVPDSQTLRSVLGGVVARAAILSTPGLADPISVARADAMFHVATGCALLIAAAFPGDSLRWLEAAAGFAMLWVGVYRAHEATKVHSQQVGVGLAHIVAKMMTPQQMQLAAQYIMRALAGSAGPVQVKSPLSGQARRESHRADREQQSRDSAVLALKPRIHEQAGWRRLRLVKSAMS
jgi:hypothetical protein